MKKSIVVLALLSLLPAVFFSAGCGDKRGNAPKPAAPQPQAAQPPAAVQKEEPKIEKEVFIYEMKGRRDPFMSLVAVAKEKPRGVKKANPVENFDVDEIKLSAIVSDNKQYYALITLPDGKSYTVKKGMGLGLYGGRVAEITKNSVIITEQVKDYKGQFKTKDTTLKLRKEGDE